MLQTLLGLMTAGLGELELVHTTSPTSEGTNDGVTENRVGTEVLSGRQTALGSITAMLAASGGQGTLMNIVKRPLRTRERR